MNKIITTAVSDPSVALPFGANQLDFIQQSVFDMLNGVCSFIVGDNFDSSKGYVISGLGHIGNIYFTGYVYFLNEDGNQELFFCPGKDITGFVHAPRLIINNTTYASYDPVEFSDSSLHNIDQIRTLDISDVVSGGCLLSTLVFCQQETITLRTKEIVSPGWNMDTTPNIGVSHGLTLSKIRGVDVVIMNNAGTALSPLTGNNYATSGSFPDANGRITIGATDLSLDARIGGEFDAAGYNNATAYITIEYVD